MGAYSYKEVMYSIPDHVIDRFEKEARTTYDGDAGYDGDGWRVTAMWIDEMQARIAELEADREETASGNLKAIKFLVDRIDALENALEPFAREEIAPMYKDAWHLQFSDPDGFVDFTDFTIGDLRRAAYLLNGKEK